LDREGRRGEPGKKEKARESARTRAEAQSRSRAGADLGTPVFSTRDFFFYV
jgi:hypothetical protein